MAAAPRKPKNKPLPTGLYQDKRGFYFRRIDGTQCRVGTNKPNAVRVANHYNSIHRVSPDLLDMVMTGKSTSFGGFLDDFKNTILPERKLTHGYLVELKRKIKIIKASMGNLRPIDVDLAVITKFLDSTSSARMFNQFRSVLTDVFNEMKDKGLVEINIPELKKPRLQAKTKKRLSVEQYIEIRKVAPTWLQIAMELSLQTAHSRAEMVSAKYSDVVDGFLRIMRKKTKKHDAAYVEIPLSKEIKRIIKASRNEIASPFIVHLKPVKITAARRNMEHWTQVTPEQLTREFKAVRDELEIFEKMPMAERPTFHEIRSLSIWLGEESGFDMQARAGHTDRDMTDLYKKGHEQKWNRVENIEIFI